MTHHRQWRVASGEWRGIAANGSRSTVHGSRFASGFTLMEVLVAVSIVGILASIAVPSYRKTVERSYWQSAKDILYTIRAGEEVYKTAPPGNPAYIDLATESTVNWSPIYMDNPNAGNPPYPTRFSVTGASTTEFLATAARGDNRCMFIDERNIITDTTARTPPAGCTRAWSQP